jgi:hypothetical protein
MGCVTFQSPYITEHHCSKALISFPCILLNIFYTASEYIPYKCLRPQRIICLCRMQWNAIEEADTTVFEPRVK